MKWQKGFNKQEIGAPLTEVVILNFEVCTLNLAQNIFMHWSVYIWWGMLHQKLL